MSQELHQLLHERARVGAMSLPLGLVLSLGFHGALIGLMLWTPKPTSKAESVKVTWVSLPAAVQSGPSGGSTAMAEGPQGERLRRVEEVAPKVPEKSGTVTPNAFGTKHTQPAKGTNPNTSSIGKAPVAAKGRTATAAPKTGAAGQGDSGGIGLGSTVPGLRPSAGVQGGTGLIGDIDGNFPFVWYLKQIQSRITENWQRVGNAQGRVQVYFRIRKDGSIEGLRVEVPSISPALDRSAELAVRRSDPLGKLPDGFEGKTLGVRFWFTYLDN